MWSAWLASNSVSGSAIDKAMNVRMIYSPVSALRHA
jgi:hypothetical protein